MRSTSLTGQGRRIIPVLLGIVFLNLRAVAQDLPAAKDRRENNFTDWVKWCSSTWGG
jgi:hypothetical protein